MRVTTTLSIAALAAVLALPAAVQAASKKETGPSSKAAAQTESKASGSYWWNDPSQYSAYEGSSTGAASGTADMTAQKSDGIGVDKDDTTQQGNVDNEGASTGAAAGTSGAGASGGGDPNTDGIGVDKDDATQQGNADNEGASTGAAAGTSGAGASGGGDPNTDGIGVDPKDETEQDNSSNQ